MNVQKSLEALNEEQRQLSERYEQVLEQIRNSDVLNENTMLRQKTGELNELCQQLKQKCSKFARENVELKLSLQQQILDERTNILNASRKKINTYFAHAGREHENRLIAAEKNAMQEIEALKSRAATKLAEEIDSIMEDISHYTAMLEEKICQQRENFANNLMSNADEFSQQVNGLAAEAVSEEIINKRIAQNAIEMKIGLSWVNKLGILFILLGAGSAAKYSYSTWFTAYMKGAFVFLVGGFLLAAGEFFYRKGKDTFAVGLLGGGIAVLYCAIFDSYFLLRIIDLSVSLGLSLLVTAAAVLLSIRYQSRTICSIGLVGGYLPFISYILAFGFKGDAFYAAMGYLFLLNLFVMLVSFRQKWIFINYISMLLHVPSLIYLVFGADKAYIGIIYAAASFAAYLAITLAYPLLYRQGLQRADVVLLGANTVFSCAVLYGLFNKAGWGDYNGVLALSFCLIYTGLAQWVSKRMVDEKYTLFLFYATALTFAILMIPFQFGMRWVSLGWLLEGAILLFYGMRKKITRLESSGWLIFGLALASFYTFDWWPRMMHGIAGKAYPDRIVFDFKYSVAVAAMTLIVMTYLHDIKLHGVGRYYKHWQKIHLFKYFVVVNVWFYLICASMRLFERFVALSYYFHFYQSLLVAGVTMLMAYSLPRVPLVRDKVVEYLSYALYTFAICIVLYTNVTIPALQGLSGNTVAAYGALGVLVMFNLLILAILRIILPAARRSGQFEYEFYPLAMMLFLLGDTTLFLTYQFNLGGDHLIFSLLYLLSGLAAIQYGFWRKLSYVRRAGLALALLATCKLFVFDLAFLTASYKIFAYFCFGFVLLGISYIYQSCLKKEKNTERRGSQNEQAL